MVCGLSAVLYLTTTAYEVDIEDGQKTGFFLDQKYNRAAVKALASGMKVLDCFTHTGSFALNAVPAKNRPLQKLHGNCLYPQCASGIPKRRARAFPKTSYRFFNFKDGKTAEKFV